MTPEQQQSGSWGLRWNQPRDPGNWAAFGVDRFFGTSTWWGHLNKSWLHPWKLTWHWKIPIFNRKYIFKWWIFHCHVSFRGIITVKNLTRRRVLKYVPVVCGMMFPLIKIRLVAIPAVFQCDDVIIPKFPVTGHQGVYHDETERPRRITCCPIRYGGLVHPIGHNLVDHIDTYIVLIYHGWSHVYPMSVELHQLADAEV